MKVQNDILNAIDNQHVTIMLLLDLSAAFDTVNHSTVLKIAWELMVKRYVGSNRICCGRDNL